MTFVPGSPLSLDGSTKVPELDCAKIESESVRFDAWYQGLPPDEKATIDGLAELDAMDARASE